MVKRLSDSEIWNKDWFLDLTDKQKLLVKFLFDNCDCAGIYEISKRVLRVCFQEEVTREDFEAIKQVRFIDENKIFIEDFIRFQYKVEISELNPKFTVHKGVLAKLTKYGIFETLSKGLGNPYPRVQDKDKDKDNTINKHIDTLNIDNNIEKKSKKMDPYINPINEIFSKEYQKVFKNKPYLLNNQRNKLTELAAEIDDFRETIPIVIEKLKSIDFDLPNFTANYTWLLKDDNYIKVLSGTYDKKKSAIEKEIENYEVDEYGN